MPDVLENALTEMGFALLDYRGNGEFLPIAKLPAWFSELWAGVGNPSHPIPLSQMSPFVENFLLEAEAFW
jgi:hypothetical protein